MFHLYGVSGRMATGSIEQLRQAAPVSAVARARRVAPVGEPEASPAAPAGEGRARDALAAYAGAGAAHERAPLRTAAEVMSRPAHTLLATASVRSAWRTLVARGIGQAPVVAGDGTLAGLAGRAELLPPALLDAALADAAAWDALLEQPVSAVMWTPVPAVAPDTELRRVAELMLATGLPGVPVVSADGRVEGFVSRSDLLRAIAADPPLDLWG
ncbi:MAG: HPP family protein [Piscinibacter sp.]|uniref:CBS domain-containing protein n=1 Tax=Piscinibacter sp. TaxID=1903157 RepID=UPI003D0CCC45